jgi:hypothetical protein
MEKKHARLNEIIRCGGRRFALRFACVGPGIGPFVRRIPEAGDDADPLAEGPGASQRRCISA